MSELTLKPPMHQMEGVAVKRQLCNQIHLVEGYFEVILVGKAISFCFRNLLFDRQDFFL